MSIALNKLDAQEEISNTVYRHSQHFFYAIAMAAPMMLWSFGYVLAELRDVIFLTGLVCVVYEIYCLRCDVQYYGEIWRRDLKIGSSS